MAPAVADPDADDLPARRSDAADIAGNVWDLAPFSPRPAALRGGEIYIYRNTYSLVPRSLGGGSRGGLRSLKFFGNDVEVLPPDSEELDGLESLQVKVSLPRVSGGPLRRMRALKELELSMVPPRPSACSILAEIAGLKCLTKLTITHFSIRHIAVPAGGGAVGRLRERVALADLRDGPVPGEAAEELDRAVGRGRNLQCGRKIIQIELHAVIFATSCRRDTF